MALPLPMTLPSKARRPAPAALPPHPKPLLAELVPVSCLANSTHIEDILLLVVTMADGGNCKLPLERLVPIIVAHIYELAGRLRRFFWVRRWRRNLSARPQARWQVMSAAASDRPHPVRRDRAFYGVTRQNVQRIADLLVAEGAAGCSDDPDHRVSPQIARPAPPSLHSIVLPRRPTVITIASPANCQPPTPFPATRPPAAARGAG